MSVQCELKQSSFFIKYFFLSHISELEMNNLKIIILFTKESLRSHITFFISIVCTCIGFHSQLLQDGTSLNGDWSHYSPGQLRKPKTNILRKLPQSSIEVGEDGSFSFNLLDDDLHEDRENMADKAVHTSVEFCPNTPVARINQTPNKRPAIKPMTADEIAPKKLKPDENSTRHQTNRRRPIISQAKNEDLMSKRLEALSKVTSHTEEEHQIVMEIHREKLRQEKIRTRILLIELKAAKRQFRN